MKFWTNRGKRVDWHPAEDTILLALEGELTPAETLHVERHLRACWICTARAAELRRGIIAFVEYQERRYVRSMPTPPHEYRSFPLRLHEAELECAPRTVLRRVAVMRRACFLRHSRAAWLSAAVASCFAVLLWLWPLANPSVVTATELLKRAELAESVSRVVAKQGSSRFLVRQKVRVQRDGKAVDREFEWPAGATALPIAEPPSTDPAEWNTPLTARGFAQWRDLLPTKRDKVLKSGDRLTLDTTTSGSPIVEGRLVVRANDFHPVEESLVFADSQELKITEISFEIREVAPVARMERTAHAEAIEPGLHTPALPEQELSNTELELRYRLFQNHWDVGQDLSISRSEGRVTLTGMADSDASAREMRQALSEIPNVDLAIRFPEDAATALPTIALQPAIGEKGTASPPVACPLQPVLEKEFPEADVRHGVVNTSLAGSDAALSHAWALKKLAQRYTEHELSFLAPPSRQQLLEMVQFHLAEVRAHNMELDSLAKIIPNENSVIASGPASWRAAIEFLFEQVERQDHQVAVLLSSGSRADPITAGKLLTSSHARIAGSVQEISDEIAAKGIEFLVH